MLLSGGGLKKHDLRKVVMGEQKGRSAARTKNGGRKRQKTNCGAAFFKHRNLVFFGDKSDTNSMSAGRKLPLYVHRQHETSLQPPEIYTCVRMCKPKS